jgi:hypothetical protein
MLLAVQDRQSQHFRGVKITRGSGGNLYRRARRKQRFGPLAASNILAHITFFPEPGEVRDGAFLSFFGDE